MKLRTFFTYVVEVIVTVALLFSIYFAATFVYQRRKSIESQGTERKAPACHCKGDCCK